MKNSLIVTIFLISLFLSPTVTFAFDTDTRLEESDSVKLIDSEQPIFIVDTTLVNPNTVVSGRVSIANMTMIFKGKFQITEIDNTKSTAIIWNSVNDQTFKPHFSSTPPDVKDIIVEGTEFIITGNFDALFKQLFPDAAAKLAMESGIDLEEAGLVVSPDFENADTVSDGDTDNDRIVDSEDEDVDNDGESDDIDNDDGNDGILDDDKDNNQSSTSDSNSSPGSTPTDGLDIDTDDNSSSGSDDDSNSSDDDSSSSSNDETSSSNDDSNSSSAGETGSTDDSSSSSLEDDTDSTDGTNSTSPDDDISSSDDNSSASSEDNSGSSDDGTSSNPDDNSNSDYGDDSDDDNYLPQNSDDDDSEGDSTPSESASTDNEDDTGSVNTDDSDSQDSSSPDDSSSSSTDSAGSSDDSSSSSSDDNSNAGFGDDLNDDNYSPGYSDDDSQDNSASSDDASTANEDGEDIEDNNSDSDSGATDDNENQASSSSDNSSSSSDSDTSSSDDNSSSILDDDISSSGSGDDSNSYDDNTSPSSDGDTDSADNNSASGSEDDSDSSDDNSSAGFGDDFDNDNYSPGYPDDSDEVQDDSAPSDNTDTDNEDNEDTEENDNDFGSDDADNNENQGPNPSDDSSSDSDDDSSSSGGNANSSSDGDMGSTDDSGSSDDNSNAGFGDDLDDDNYSPGYSDDSDEDQDNSVPSDNNATDIEYTEEDSIDSDSDDADDNENQGSNSSDDSTSSLNTDSGSSNDNSSSSSDEDISSADNDSSSSAGDDSSSSNDEPSSGSDDDSGSFDDNDEDSNSGFGDDLDDDNYAPDYDSDDSNTSDDDSSPNSSNDDSTSSSSDDSNSSSNNSGGSSNDGDDSSVIDDITDAIDDIGGSGSATTTDDTVATTEDNDSDSDDDDDEVTVSGIETVSCDNVVDYATGVIYIRSKTVTSYSDGSTSETSCVNSQSYSLESRSDDCNVRNDFIAGLSYLQREIGYTNNSGTFVTLKACHDTTTTYTHLKSSGTCSLYYDSDTNRVYDKKKTYYVDSSGNMVFISDCQIDSTSYTTVSSADYLREYSDSDSVDLTALTAYKRYREYIRLNDSTEYVSSWQDDISSPMTVYKDYDDCSYVHDLSAGYSYRQFKYVYDRDGETRVASSCQKDTVSPYSHITDSKFCSPTAVDRTLYSRVSTYFIDSNGSRVVVADCSMTDQPYVADSDDIIKDYDDCEPRVDYDAMLAYASYVEKFIYGSASTTISSCIEDTSVYYPLKITYDGCAYRIDSQAGRAYLQSRLYYNKGDANVYVSDCADSDISTQLIQSTDACTPKVSGDALVQYQQTYYINNSGDKVIVQNCAATDATIPITEDLKVYDYDSCGVLIDSEAGKAYKKYQTYVEILGERTLIKSCMVDYNKFYNISETTDGCDLRHDFTDGLSYVRARQIYLDDSGNDVEVTSCYDTAKSHPHMKMVDTCSPTYDSTANSVYETKKTYYVDDSGNINFITSCLIDSTSASTLTADVIKIEYLTTDYVDYSSGYAYKRYREYIILSDETKEYVSAVKIDYDNPMEIVRDYSECSYYNDTIAGFSYPRYEGVYYRDGVKKVVSSCQADKSISFAHITDSKYCAPQVNNMTAYEKVSTYFLNESNTRVVVSDCELNGDERIISADDIEKDYDSCTPRIDYENLTVFERYKEYVTFNSTVSYLSECQVDTDLTYPITLTSQGCSYRIDADSQKAIQQKRYYYSDGSNEIYITACSDSDDAYDFVSSSANCEPGVSADGLNFIDKAETYFIDSTATKHIVSECAATGSTTPIPESSKYKDFSGCAPEVSIDDMLAYGRYQLFVDNGTNDVMIQDCSVDESVTFAIQEDFSSCGVSVDTVNNVANQYRKLYYSTGDTDVYVSSCVSSDISYPIKETANGCSYSVDLDNHLAVKQMRTYYKDNAGVINYLTECADTEVETGILSSTDNCEQTLSDDGVHLNEMAESYYYDSDGQKVIVQACSATGNSSDLPEDAYSRNYENCDYLLSFTDGVAYLQYQTYVTYGDSSFMVEACQPDYDTPYTLYRDFSKCSPKVDLVRATVTETAEWYFKRGTDDVKVTDCIETDTTYPTLSRTDICEVLEIDNDPSNVIEQSILYYVDSNNNIQYISECQPTSTTLAVTIEITPDRYIHNYAAGESYIAVVSKYGDQVVSDTYASPLHAAMPHLLASCGWSHDDTNFRSTYNVRTYITDAITDATVYLDECHPSNQFISYSYTGSTTYDNNDGGHSGSCSAGLFWYGALSTAARYCNHSSSWPYTTSYLSLHGNEFNARTSVSNWITRYKAVYHNYSRPDGSIYQLWWKNYCGINDATIATASEYNGDLCGTTSGQADAVRVLSQWYGSANNFGNLRLGWSQSD